MDFYVRFLILSYLFSGLVCGAYIIPSVRLNSETFRQYFGVTVGRCRDECLARPKCQSFNYRLRVRTCTLYAFNSTERALVPMAGYVYADKESIYKASTMVECYPTCGFTDVCERLDGQDRCIIKECPSPQLAEGIEVLGNVRHIGARILYVCGAGFESATETTNQIVRSSCLPDGIWSSVYVVCIKPCLADWTGYGGSCYLVGNSKPNYNNAKDFCEDKGSHLVFIESEAESTFVVDFLQSKSTSVSFVYLGMTDFDTDGSWTYEGTNVSATYLYFGDDQPDNRGGVEFCVGAFAYDNFKWHDMRCTWTGLPLCEMEMTSTIPVN